MTLNKVLSGAEFNRLFGHKQFFKLTIQTEKHNGFQFTTGLNIDDIPFNPTEECKPGGLYFCDLDCLHIWINYSGETCVYYRTVIIPDDAKVYIERQKYKADKFILSERKEIWTDEKMCELIVSKRGETLSFVKNQTERIC